MKNTYRVECKVGCSYEHKTDRAPVQCGMCGGYEVRVWQVVYDTLDAAAELMKERDWVKRTQGDRKINTTVQAAEAEAEKQAIVEELFPKEDRAHMATLELESDYGKTEEGQSIGGMNTTLFKGIQ